MSYPPSGHRTFDRQCDLITTGNVCSRTLHSGFIRAYTDTHCNERDFPLGALRTFDLQSFRLPARVHAAVIQASATQPILLYEVRHFRGSHKLIDGYLLTTTRYAPIARFRTGRTYKSDQVLDVVSHQVTTVAAARVVVA